LTWEPIAYTAASYLLGAIPTGYWMGLRLKGIDVRQHGSGNLGATNVLRVLGKGPGMLTLAFDIAKGILPVIGAQRFFPNGWEIALAAGVAAILGHSTSPFVGFKGGKGVATTAGAFGALLPAPTLLAVIVFGISLILSRIVSLSSILGAIALGIGAFFFSSIQPLAYAATGMSALVIWKHRANITRLLQGTEPRLGQASRG